MLVGITDFLIYKIPNIIIIPCFLAGFIYHLTSGGINELLAYLPGLVLGLIAIYFFSKDYIAGGDVKLLLAVGIWFGLKYTLIITLMACVFGIIWAIIKSPKIILDILTLLRYIILKLIFKLKNLPIIKELPSGNDSEKYLIPYASGNAIACLVCYLLILKEVL